MRGRWETPGARMRLISRCVANGAIFIEPIDKQSRTVDFLLSKRRDMAAAKRQEPPKTPGLGREGTRAAFTLPCPTKACKGHLRLLDGVLG